VARASCPSGFANSKERTGKTPAPLTSPFASFLKFSDWLYARLGRTDSIALARLAELLFEFLTGELKLERKATAETLRRDWQRCSRRDAPEFLRRFLPVEAAVQPRAPRIPLPKRQARHLAA
jgi:hypothetical protein